jgi:hypothetical protein
MEMVLVETALSPSPLWGGVRGGGNPDIRCFGIPPLPASPIRGEKKRAAGRTAFVERLA